MKRKQSQKERIVSYKKEPYEADEHVHTSDDPHIKRTAEDWKRNTEAGRSGFRK